MDTQKETIPLAELYDGENGAIILPGGMKIGEELVRNIVFRELSGVEEDILADRRKAHGGKGKLLKSGSARVSEILARCTLSIGGKEHRENEDPAKANEKHFLKEWKDCYSGDRAFALVALRRMSLGDEYKFNDSCPECKKEIRNLTVDLSTLDVYPFFRNVKPNDVLKEEIDEERARIVLERQSLLMKDEHTITLPSGKEVVWHNLRGKDEDAQSNDIQVRKQDVVTAAMIPRIISVDGQPANYTLVKNLTTKDRTFLRNLFDEVEGGVDTLIEVECDNEDCNAQFSRKLNLGKPSFFFPSGT